MSERNTTTDEPRLDFTDPASGMPMPTGELLDYVTPSGLPRTLSPSLIAEEVVSAYLSKNTQQDLRQKSRRLIVQELLDLMNETVGAHNKLMTMAKENWRKLPQILSIPAAELARVIARYEDVIRIAPSGHGGVQDHDLLAVYSDAGNTKGLHLTSHDEIYKLVLRWQRSTSKVALEDLITGLRAVVPRRPDETDPDLIPLNNGVFNYRTKELLEFSPDYVFRSKAAVDWNPDATCDVIIHPEDGTEWDVESWMEELSDDPGVPELLWQIIGATLRPGVRWNKAALLHSTLGNNGKGTLVQLMRSILGPRAWVSIPLREFGEEFKLEGLVGSQAVLVDENDVGVFLDKVSNLKAVITGDAIQVNRKYKSPISFQFRGFVVQCVNADVRTKDRSESWNRRLMIVPFKKSFTGRERKYIKNDYLRRKDVQEYVVKRVMTMDDYYEFDEPPAVLEMLDTYRVDNDPVRRFFDQFRDRFAWDLLPFDFLYDLYLAWRKQDSPGAVPMSAPAFRNDLLSVVANDDVWYVHAKGHRTKIARSHRMARVEPLAQEYGLHDWRNWKARQANYRGLLRLGTVPMPPTQSALNRAPDPVDSQDDSGQEGTA